MMLQCSEVGAGTWDEIDDDEQQKRTRERAAAKARRMHEANDKNDKNREFSSVLNFYERCSKQPALWRRGSVLGS
jgi:hypothetical protein